MVTNKNFEDLREQIIDSYNKWKDLNKKIKFAKTKLFFLSIIQYRKKNQQEVVKELENQLSENNIKLTFSDGSQLEKSWFNFVSAFNKLMKSEKIWDVTYAENVDRTKARTVAQRATKRKIITQIIKEIEFIKSDLPYLFLPNTNSADLFFFPTFLILFNKKVFKIFDLKNVKLILKPSGYLEEEKVPKDADIIRYTWKKANNDGSPDKRFNGNYQIPVVEYGEMMLKSEEGLEEAYMFSNGESFTEFAKAYEHHVSYF